MKVKVSHNKMVWTEGLIVGYNPITERFLIADPKKGNLVSYNFIADLDENIISYSELEKYKAEQKELAIASLVNLKSKFSA